MSDACYTARPTNRANTIERVDKLHLEINESGQYPHDAIEGFFKSLDRELAGMFNPLDTGRGMAGLLAATPNNINNIKSNDIFTADIILRESKAEAARITQQTGATATPTITTRADAQEEADRRNQAYQAVIGVKEGVTEAIVKKVGKDVTDPILRDINGKDYKSIDDYSLSDLKQAVIAAADRPNTPDVLKQVIAVIDMKFDFRKKVAANAEMQKALAANVQAYGINIGPAQMVLTVLSNVEQAMQHDWGREFRPAMQNIRKKYLYNHVHDEVSYQDILNEFAAADTVRILREAPAPNEETANAVSDTTNLFQHMMQSAQDYEETAFAAQSSGSESDSSRSRERKSKKKSKHRDRDRSRGRNRSRGRSHSRNDERPRNKCKHCKDHRRYSGAHDADRCFYNKEYKGWRPSRVCADIGVPYKPKGKFSKEMGGWSSSDEE